jgi:hypothetical protein
MSFVLIEARQLFLFDIVKPSLRGSESPRA